MLGLHPDQATNTILRFALEHRKPLAIVPCCVLPSLFSHRRLHSSDQANQSSSILSPSTDFVSVAGASLPLSRTVQVTLQMLSTALNRHVSGADTGAGAGALGTQGQPVQTYMQLVQYLVQQGGKGTCVASLPFVGANQVVFRALLQYEWNVHYTVTVSVTLLYCMCEGN